MTLACPAGTPAALENRVLAFLDAFSKSALAAAGVKPPSGVHFWALMLLWENMGCPVSQAQIAQFYIDHGLGHYNRQVRHKATAGWSMVSGKSRTQNMQYDPSFADDEIGLLSLEPNPRLTANRKVNFSGLEWEQKIKLFESRPGISGGCGVCGLKCIVYDRGHLNRHQPMDIDNIVPMCSPCNNWLQGRNLDAYLEPDTLIVRPLLPGSIRFDRQRRKKIQKNAAKRAGSATETA